MTDIFTNLIFSLNATMPIFFMMVLGFWLKKIKFLDENEEFVTTYVEVGDKISISRRLGC